MAIIVALLMFLRAMCNAEPESSHCLNPVNCTFGTQGEIITVCAPNAVSITELCTRLSKCNNCTEQSHIRPKNPNISEGHTLLSKGIAKLRSKRQRPNRGRPNGFLQGTKVLSCPFLDGSNLFSLVCDRKSSTEETCRGRCHDGYHFELLSLQEEITLTCNGGVWTPFDEFPNCKRNVLSEMNYCKDPGISSHSIRVPSKTPGIFGFPQGSVVNYSCDQYYSLKGQQSLICLETREWSHNAPICIAPLPIPGENCIESKPRDCSDLMQMGYNTSGAYKIWPLNRLTENQAIDVYCDMETRGGGWTVIQRRKSFSPNEDFNRGWHEYRMGFGDINKEFWLGNDNIFAITNQRIYMVRFDLTDFEWNRADESYGTFYIDDVSNNYTLHITWPFGEAGDAMESHNNKQFSTKDRDNDDSEENCAEKYESGWWFSNCFQANLNGVYQTWKNRYNTNGTGIRWNTWKSEESLEWVEIKIRPNHFYPSLTKEGIPQSDLG